MERVAHSAAASLPLKRGGSVVGPWPNKKFFVTLVLVGEGKDGARAWTMRLTRPLSKMDRSDSLDMGDEWKTWHMDDPDFESDEAADEGSKEEKRKKKWNMQMGEVRRNMSSNPVDG